jgi:hypothetical protein
MKGKAYRGLKPMPLAIFMPVALILRNVRFRAALKHSSRRFFLTIYDKFRKCSSIFLHFVYN